MVGILFALLFGLIAGFVALIGLTYLRAYVRIARTDTTDVADVTGGMDEVALSGTARAIGDPVPARFDDADAVITTWDVSERRGSGDNKRWSTLESGQVAEPFVLDDGTGEVVVDPEGAEWVFDDHVESYDDEMPPRPVREFLSAAGMTPNVERSGRTRKRRYKEGRLEDGEEVYVYGPVKDDTAETGADDRPDNRPGPSIETERTPEDGMTTRTTMRLTPGVLPFVGDPEETLSLGGSSESALFTVADASATSSQRRYLKRGALLVFVSLWFAAVPALFVFAG